MQCLEALGTHATRKIRIVASGCSCSFGTGHRLQRPGREFLGIWAVPFKRVKIENRDFRQRMHGEIAMDVQALETGAHLEHGDAVRGFERLEELQCQGCQGCQGLAATLRLKLRPILGPIGQVLTRAWLSESRSRATLGLHGPQESSGCHRFSCGRNSPGPQLFAVFVLALVDSQGCQIAASDGGRGRTYTHIMADKHHIQPAHALPFCSKILEGLGSSTCPACFCQVPPT